MRILLVDGSPDDVRTLREFLERPGHEVAVATNGPDGLAAGLTFHPDVIVCDLVLPGSDGIAPCEELRRSRTPPISFIGWTCLVSPDARDRAEAVGFDAVIAKPHLSNLLGFLALNPLPVGAISHDADPSP